MDLGSVHKPAGGETSRTDPWSIGHPGRARTVDGPGIRLIPGLCGSNRTQSTKLVDARKGSLHMDLGSAARGSWETNRALTGPAGMGRALCVDPEAASLKQQA